MSKIGQWVFEMQEDASYMTLDQFIKTHGSSQSHIWKEVNGPLHFESECEDRFPRVAYSQQTNGSPF
jgi:phage-related protein